MLVTVGWHGGGRMDADDTRDQGARHAVGTRTCATAGAHGGCRQNRRDAGGRGARLADQALSACLALVQPVLDQLTARLPRQEMIRPLARKISSAIGVAEIALLKMSDQAWMPLATGQLSLDAIVSADAWLAVRETARAMPPERLWALSPFARCHEFCEMNKSDPTSNRDGADQDQFLTIQSREEALARFEAALFPRDLAVEERALSDALGLALANDVVAAMDVPPFDRSNVDGFAVRSADLATAAKHRRFNCA